MRATLYIKYCSLFPGRENFNRNINFTQFENKYTGHLIIERGIQFWFKWVLLLEPRKCAHFKGHPFARLWSILLWLTTAHHISFNSILVKYIFPSQMLVCLPSDHLSLLKDRFLNQEPVYFSSQNCRLK